MTRRVLIAEDEESIVASLEFLMRKAGFETRVARDGATALALVADFCRGEAATTSARASARTPCCTARAC
jgi:DNA-binding NtrC family response regulator